MVLCVCTVVKGNLCIRDRVALKTVLRRVAKNVLPASSVLTPIIALDGPSPTVKAVTVQL